jgi:hypothetical protein
MKQLQLGTEILGQFERMPGSVAHTKWAKLISSSNASVKQAVQIHVRSPAYESWRGESRGNFSRLSCHPFRHPSIPEKTCNRTNCPPKEFHYTLQISTRTSHFLDGTDDLCTRISKPSTGKWSGVMGRQHSVSVDWIIQMKNILRHNDSWSYGDWEMFTWTFSQKQLAMLWITSLIFVGRCDMGKSLPCLS